MERVPERLASCVENSRFSAETILRVNALSCIQISILSSFNSPRTGPSSWPSVHTQNRTAEAGGCQRL